MERGSDSSRDCWTVALPSPFASATKDGPEATEVARKAIEDYPPYYGWLIEEDREETYPYRYPVEDAYIGYASRGCVRKCKFCGVPTLEGDQKVLSNMKGWVGRDQANQRCEARSDPHGQQCNGGAQLQGDHG